MRNLAALLVLAAGCSRGAAAPESARCAAVKVYSVDPRFSPDQRELASRAVAEWDEVTSPGLCLRVGLGGVRIVPVVDEAEMGAIDFAAKVPEGTRAIGWWDGRDVRVSLARIQDRRVVYSVILHEVGHSLGLPHYFGDGLSYMRPSVGPAWTYQVPPADARHFRSTHRL